MGLVKATAVLSFPGEIKKKKKGGRRKDVVSGGGRVKAMTRTLFFFGVPGKRWVCSGESHAVDSLLYQGLAEEEEGERTRHSAKECLVFSFRTAAVEKGEGRSSSCLSKRPRKKGYRESAPSHLITFIFQ